MYNSLYDSFVTAYLGVVLEVAADDDGDDPGAARHHPLDVAGGEVGGEAPATVREPGPEHGVQLLAQDAWRMTLIMPGHVYSTGHVHSTGHV